MDVILKVLEGAKTGTKIAVKKDEFLIGRSQKCHLCAGSSSVSRNHCAITRKDTAVSIRDLGSRNGTLVNDKKISEEVVLSSGDEIGIGTLKLLVTITHGITNLKRPKVKTVADAVQRAVAAGDSSVGEEDITKWLLDGPGPTGSHPTGSHPTGPNADGPHQGGANLAASETQTIRMDDTNAVQLQDGVEKQDATASAAGASAESAALKNGQDAAAESSAGDPPESTDKTKKHDGKKKAPGKLPPRPHEVGSKDSREAAMQALRNWNRRR